MHFPAVFPHAVHYKVLSDSSLQIHPHRISLSGHCFLSYYFPLTFCLLCCLKSANSLSECSINIIQNPQLFFKHVCIDNRELCTDTVLKFHNLIKKDVFIVECQNLNVKISDTKTSYTTFFYKQ